MEITPNKKLISISKPTFNLSPFTIPLHPFPGIKTSAWTSWRQSRMCGTSSTRMTSTTNRRRPAKIEVSRCMLFSGPCPAVRFCKVSFYFQLIYFWFRLSAGISLCLLYAPLSLFFLFWYFFHFILFMFSSFSTFFVCSVFIWLLSQFALNESWGELNGAFCFGFDCPPFPGLSYCRAMEFHFYYFVTIIGLSGSIVIQRREQCESGGGDSRGNWFASFLSLSRRGLDLEIASI